MTLFNLKIHGEQTNILGRSYKERSRRVVYTVYFEAHTRRDSSGTDSQRYSQKGANYSAPVWRMRKFA